MATKAKKKTVDVVVRLNELFERYVGPLDREDSMFRDELVERFRAENLRAEVRRLVLAAGRGGAGVTPARLRKLRADLAEVGRIVKRMGG